MVLSLKSLRRSFRRVVAKPAYVSGADREKIARLLSLLDCPPKSKSAQNAWTLETASLIKDLFLTRISPEDLAAILAGIMSHRKSGITSEETQLALIRVFCRSNGVAQELLHRVLCAGKAPSPSDAPVSQFFGRFSDNDRAVILKSLKDTGYAVLPARIPAEIVAEMKAATLEMDYDLRAAEKRLGGISKINPDIPPLCTTADALDEQVAAHPLFHALLHDPQILSIVEQYVDAPVSLIASPLRYTFPSETASADAAQMYHYDLDTLRWLKVFYYLSDVGPENGPHVCVQGSHAPGAKSPELLRREYGRITDQEIAAHQPGTEYSIQGPAGTVVLGDTRAYHKGLNVKSGYRLMLFPLYAPSTLGFYHGAPSSLG